jgi:hypothetical protein
MQSPIEQVETWINTKQSPSFTISKEEHGDLDQININIEKVSLGTQPVVDPDGYVAEQALLLHGQGSLINGAPLPQNVYEIPLFGTWVTHDKGSRMQIETERAVYTIQTTTS